MPHKCDFCEKISTEGFFSDVKGGTYWFCSFECEEELIIANFSARIQDPKIVHEG